MTIRVTQLEGTGNANAGVKGVLAWNAETSDLNAVSEQPSAGLDVLLKDGNGLQIASTTTDAAGEFRFETSQTGAYTVEIDNAAAQRVGVMPGGNFDSTAIASGTLAAGVFRPADSDLFLRSKGSVAYNLTTIEDFSLNQPLTNIGSYGRLIRPQANNIIIEDVDKTTGFPLRMEAGETQIQMFFSRSFTGPNNPVNGKPFAIRHNLPATYTIQPSITHTDISASRIETIAVSGSWRIEINGPEGDFPAGWFMEVIQIEDEARYDNTSLPLVDRYFTPEYVAELDAANMDHFRCMDIIFTNNDLTTRTIEDSTDLNNYHYGQRLPLALAVALANRLDCGLWWTVKAAATDALVTHEAQFVLDNLNPHLRVRMEYLNEAWNALFVHSRWLAAQAIKRYGDTGQGTISVVRNNATITGTGTNFDQVFGDAPLVQRIVIDDLTYDIDPNQPITATSMSTVGFSSTLPRTTVTDDIYYVPPDRELWNDRGYAIRATQIAKIWNDVFIAGNARHRLINTVGGRQTSSTWNNGILDAVDWQSEPDYIDPKTVFDNLAITGYFYDGIEIAASSGYAIRNKITDLFENGEQQKINTMVRDLMLNHGGTNIGTAVVDGVTYTNPRSMYFMAALMRNATTIANLYGMKSSSYEGSYHGIQSSVFGGNIPANTEVNLVGAYTAFMSSPEALEVHRAWAQAHVDEINGPVMQYVFMGPWSKFGFWGSRPEYGYAGDSRTQVLDESAALAPYYDAA